MLMELFVRRPKFLLRASGIAGFHEAAVTTHETKQIAAVAFDKNDI